MVCGVASAQFRVGSTPLPRLASLGAARPPKEDQVSTETEAATVAPPALAIADPAPLGLAAFALTTFLLSAVQRGPGEERHRRRLVGYAFAYGGLGQLLAGMWEFKNKNVFGATAFSTYGGFWIGVGLWAHFSRQRPRIRCLNGPGLDPARVRDLQHLHAAHRARQLNMAVFLVFLTLELTEIFLFLGNFTKVAALPPDPTNSSLIVIGGYHRHPHRALRLVHLGRRRDQRHQGRRRVPSRQAAHVARHAPRA